MSKGKYYVVWQGRREGVFSSWSECKKAVDGYSNAKYKSFENKLIADNAFKVGYSEFFSVQKLEKNTSVIGGYTFKSIAVDAAWDTSTGLVEYQGIYIPTKEIIFKEGPYEDGTNNIGEFLAIVRGLIYLKQENSSLPLYSDSSTAIHWVNNKVANTKHQRSDRNETLFQLRECKLNCVR